ncbi:hypothetical protein HDV06_001344 [Boothiomyces sp. JEL0866]|nr:hypothetical protein HDV06_001344 [Boothiomyces sp. JEL0866]
MKKNLNQHAGEIAVQQLRGISSEDANPSWYISPEMPKQHSDFFANLLYFPFGAIDTDGKLWATILVNPKVDILSPSNFQLDCRVNETDPFLSAVLDSKYFSAVGVDFTNRRRNKVNGNILSASFQNGLLRLVLQATENMGNCPKYITVRQLQYFKRTAQAPQVLTLLNEEARDILNSCSTIFMVTKHLTGDLSEYDLGFNHRGGPKGFLRYFERDNVGNIVLPDYSGNRFYQSLGNIQSDNAAGLVIPNFETGDLLYVTGRARNVFDKEAEEIMPRMSLITIIVIEKAVLIKEGLDLKLIGNETLSPYNPPVRLLRSEMNSSSLLDNSTPISLINIEKISSQISTFTFSYPDTVNDKDCLPGSYCIVDFSRILTRRYQHMNNANPQLINEDFIRTWTISRLDRGKKHFSVTVKLAGLISKFLHSLQTPIEHGLYLKGFGGEFSCFPNIPQKMIWFAAGVGITPFMAMHDELAEEMHSRVTLVFSCRGDEQLLINNLKVKTIVFDSTAPSTTDIVQNRRIQESDFDYLDFENAEVYICGPAQYMENIKNWSSSKVPLGSIKYENFSF